MSYDFYDFPHRTVCSVLEAMRKAYETRNFSHLLGLIEEAQVMVDRMEAALSDQKDVRQLTEKRSNLRKEVNELKKQAKALGKKEEE